MFDMKMIAQISNSCSKESAAKAHGKYSVKACVLIGSKAASKCFENRTI